MTGEDKIRTRYEWLAALASKSKVVRKLDVKDIVSDAVFGVAKEKVGANADAFNLSNSTDHNDAIVDTIQKLEASGVSSAALKKLIIDLTSQNTYGTFAELSAYRFLLKGKHRFDIQAPMNGASILNPNGSDLDGVVRLPEEIFFDVKGFGFLDHLVNRLIRRLSEDVAPQDHVVAQDSWDVSAELLTCLLGKQYQPLLDELLEKRKATRDLILFSVRLRQAIQVTERETNPERLAGKNAEYTFRFAKQFARNKPFFLMFVLHPWFSGSLSINFAGSLDTFTSEFAKQIFCQFESDTQLLFELKRAEVARLLSGIIFIDAWEGTPSVVKPSYRLFLNPNATNKPKAESVAAFAAPYGADITVDEMTCG